MRIVVGSLNQGKIAEYRRMFDELQIEVESMQQAGVAPDVDLPEDGDTFYDNALSMPAMPVAEKSVIGLIWTSCLRLWKVSPMKIERHTLNARSFCSGRSGKSSQLMGLVRDALSALGGGPLDSDMIQYFSRMALSKPWRNFPWTPRT
ncbi:MAG: hypothetical protein JRJ87_10185 [Deltaproteobacteria bacterium]|nr:hypothetical protein [Deltaproteobacteria bacterium]